MPNEVTKKVRMDRATAARLARLAKRQKASESEILRQGIELVERERLRDQAWDDLIEMAKGPPPRRLKFRLKG